MTSFDMLAREYDRNRIGYAPELYDEIVAYGLRPGSSVLDVACGTGLAGGPFAANGYRVTGVDNAPAMIEIAQRNYPEATWVVGSAERLAFRDDSIDAVVSGQAFHHLQRAVALDEIRRVLRPGGIVAIWWKHLMYDDLLKGLREAVAADLGKTLPPSGLGGGFKEFYSARWSQTSLRVIPWRTTMPLSRTLGYERSRKSVHDVFGTALPEYLSRLEARLRERVGEGDPAVPLAYIHYLYLAKT
jgi:ubiquinone/menaquinone biosynthesis C-methylase UbiE